MAKLDITKSVKEVVTKVEEKTYNLTLTEEEMLVVGALCGLVTGGGHVRTLTGNIWNFVHSHLSPNNTYFHRDFFNDKEQDVRLSSNADYHLKNLMAKIKR